jgi:hypothetical protein
MFNLLPLHSYYVITGIFLTTKYRCLFQIQAPLKLPCETNIDYSGINQHTYIKSIFYNTHTIYIIMSC